MQAQGMSVAANAQQILAQLRRVVVGKEQTLIWVLATVLAKGHILLEDIPGVGKTTMALAFSKTLNLECNRVQFTPDVLPSDVTGYSVLQQSTGEMVYQPGAVLCNLFLADELNRATSRTQSALLEAMEEGQVTVDGVTHVIPRPFTVIATQNPTGAAGTQLLPDSQMDRFTIRLSMGYPAPEDELTMVLNRQNGNPLDSLQPILERNTLTTLQDAVAQTYIKESLVRYIVALVSATRNHPDILRGASPRATLAMTAMAKSIAQLQGRNYVVPADVKTVFLPTVAHRLLLSPSAEAKNLSAETILGSILSAVPAPALN
jgi:MoxR-like ATPase